MDTPNDNPLLVIIAPNQLAAELVIPALLPREGVTKEACLDVLQKRGVELTAAVTQAVEALVSALPTAGADHRATIATGVPAVNGDDEQVRWLVNDAVPAAHDPYAQFAGAQVRLGQVMGRVTAATPGRPGRAVTGKPIAPVAGRAALLKLAAGIVRDGDGQLIAQIDGVLRRSHGSASVLQHLDARGLAETAGNINYKGDVIAPGICDQSVVKCTGTVEIARLIGAALIECGGDLLARGGMAGRTSGKVKVGGSFCAKYLDKVTGTIAGDLIVENEMMNCDLTIGGGARVERGSIRGGNITATGAVLVAELGSDRAATHLILGTVPFCQPLAAQLEGTRDKILAHCDTLVAQQRAIAKKEGKATAAERERQTEIIFEIQTANQSLSRVLAGIEALAVRIKEKRTVDLRVLRRCAAGVQLTIAAQTFTLREPITGPFQITLNAAGEPQLIKDGHAPCSLAALNRPSRAAA